MPVIINNTTGVAENLSAEQAKAALESGTHSVPLVDPQGNPVSIEYKQAQDALNQGYIQPDQNQLKDLMQYAKYSSPVEQAKTFAEGAASAATFGLSTGIERAAGVAPEEIRARREVNPGMHMAGQATGLIGSSVALPGAGAAGLMTRAGEAAAAATGLQGATLASRAAIAGAKQIAETALFQAGDEVSKAFAGDPDQSVSSALADIGLAGIAGGALGFGTHFVAAPLWKVTQGPKLMQVLSGLKSKVDGSAITANVSELAGKAGVELKPEIVAALSPDVQAREAAQVLAEGAGTFAGRRYQQGLTEMRDEIAKKALQTLGKTEDDIGVAASDAVLGKQGKEQFKRVFTKRAEEATKAYESFEAKIADARFPKSLEQDLSSDMVNAAIQNKFNIEVGSPEMAQVNKYIDSLANVNTYSDFVGLNSNISSKMFKDNPRLYAVMKPVMDKYEDAAATTLFQTAAPEVLAQYSAAKAQYRELKQLTDVLNQRFRVGKAKTPRQFAAKVAKLTPEAFISKISKEADSEMLTLLQQQFPELAQTAKQYHLNNIPLNRLADGNLNLNSMFKSIDDMSPEMKSFVFDAPTMEKIEALRQLKEAIPSRLGPSGTPKAVDAMFGQVPGGVGAVIGLLTGKGLGAGYLVGQGAKLIGREAPDALRLAYLKLIGSEAVTSPAGFNAMFKMAEAAYRGAQKTDKAVRGLFRPAAPAFSEALAPTAKSLKLIDKAVMAAQEDPQKMLESNEDVAHYLPDHAMHLTATMARAVSHLASLRPQATQKSILDTPTPPSDVEIAKYNRALEIAAQPLSVLNRVKDGSITVDDIKTMSAIYPSMYKNLRERIMAQLTESKLELPYSTKLGLSMFLGMPLESSMMPNNIMTNQGLHTPPQMLEKKPRSGVPSSLKASKLPSIYSTPEQLREQKRSK